MSDAPLLIEALYTSIRQRLRAADIHNADLVARIFMKESLGLNDADFITWPPRTVNKAELVRIEGLVERRLAGEPVSRVLGMREFWGLPFVVTPDVLDPRPDTETLIEAALRAFGDSPPRCILDLGTGSGCIVVALLHEWRQTQAVAVDISSAALGVAADNAARNHVADRLDLRQGSWLEPIKKNERFDLIVSNPPYIPENDIPNLDIEVRNHDPILALDGGIDGLESYKLILSQIKNALSPSGKILFEIGAGQDSDLTRLVEDSGFPAPDVHADLAGIPRVVEISSGDK